MTSDYFSDCEIIGSEMVFVNKLLTGGCNVGCAAGGKCELLGKQIEILGGAPGHGSRGTGKGVNKILQNTFRECYYYHLLIC